MMHNQRAKLNENPCIEVDKFDNRFQKRKIGIKEWFNELREKWKKEKN
jgi:hypothetical protein